jgi:transcriptional regulator with XRE-family HTH domain
VTNEHVVGVADWVPADTFALRLRILRHQLGVSVEEIAGRCRVSPATWSNWERGSRPRDLAQVVARVAAETGVSRDWLMWGGPLVSLSTRWLTALPYRPAVAA